MQGKVISEVLIDQRTFDLFVCLDEHTGKSLESLSRMSLALPEGGTTPLSSVASICPAGGPNTINREQVRRRLVVQCNTAGRGLVDVVQDIQSRLKPIQESLPAGYFIEYGGQFESQQTASRRIAALLAVSLVECFSCSTRCSVPSNFALQVMSAIPMALIGAVAASRPDWPDLDDRQHGRVYFPVRHRHSKWNSASGSLLAPGSLRRGNLVAADDCPRGSGTSRPGVDDRGSRRESGWPLWCWLQASRARRYYIPWPRLSLAASSAARSWSSLSVPPFSGLSVSRRASESRRTRQAKTTCRGMLPKASACATRLNHFRDPTGLSWPVQRTMKIIIFCQERIDRHIGEESQAGTEVHQCDVLNME